MSLFHFVFNTKKYNHYSTKKNYYWRVNFVILSIIFMTWNKQLRQQSKRKHPVNCYSVFFCFLVFVFVVVVCFSKMSLQSLKAATEGVLWKKVFLKFSKIYMKTPVPESCNFIKQETDTQVFSFKFCEIFKNCYFTEYLRTTASQIESRKRYLKVGMYSEPIHDASLKMTLSH